jgi:gliding motility-associated-like protein
MNTWLTNKILYSFRFFPTLIFLCFLLGPIQGYSQSPPLITGPNGTGTTTGTTSAKSIFENTTPIYTFTANETVTWSITGGTDQAKFNLNASTGALSFITAPDYENPADADVNNTYIVIITATNSSNKTTSQTLTVTLIDVDDTPPVITGPNGTSTTTVATSAKSIPENTTPVYTFTADEPVIWSKTGGPDQAKFTLNSTSGVLSFSTAPDYENPTDADANNTYIVIITATDFANNTASQTLTVTVTDADDPPPIVTGPGLSTASTSAISISENTTPVYTFTANKTVTWSLTGGVDQVNFTINASSGALNFTTAPDFENPIDAGVNNTYIVVITATDLLNHITSQTLTVTVTNANDAPTNLALSQIYIYENNPPGTTIGFLSTIDPDAGDTFTYSLISGDISAFTISGKQLKAAISYKFDIKNTYNIRLRTTDAGGLTFEKDFKINILKAPEVTATGNFSGTAISTPPGNNVTISKGFTSQLNVTGSGLVSYSWSPNTALSSTNIANPVATPTQSTTYSVTVTNTLGISTVLSVVINVIEDYNITPTNVITPNGDGINDFWLINNLNSYPDNYVRIFDKAGRMLYEVKNYQNNWDGTLDGHVLSESAYYYIITIGTQGFARKGYITIIRN